MIEEKIPANEPEQYDGAGRRESHYLGTGRKNQHILSGNGADEGDFGSYLYGEARIEQKNQGGFGHGRKS